MSHLTPEQWKRVEAAFAQVCDLAGDQQAAYLAEIDRTEPDIARELRSLLDVRDTAGTFLEDSALSRIDFAPFRHDNEPMLGKVIGRFRLTERIAGGGMGVVYRAERADRQFDQQVAVKLIRLDMTDEELRARFRNERQVLANLSHPNIAQLFDGGTTDDGLPYLVMEYVDGTRIDEYCDQQRLTIEERLDLFRSICDAVQHAHQRLVIHRDLKPSNILVTNDGTVKLLDFGIARMLEDDAGAGATAGEVTRTAKRRFTPAYASPEQIRNDPAVPVTTASDIYSLGAVLYELVTGHRPYALKGTSDAELEEHICRRPPTRPSAVVTPVRRNWTAQSEGSRAGHAAGSGGSATASLEPPTSQSIEQVAADRGTDPARLRRLIRGDLETILLTALAKEPQRRYASVQQFSDDLRRFLRREPIVARPPSTLYQLRKFVERNAVLTMAGMGIAITLLVAVAGTSIGMIQARAAAAEAQRQTRIAEAVNTFLNEDLLGLANPAHNPTRQLTIEEALDAASARVAGRFDEEPLIQAAIFETIGMACYGLGRYDESHELLTKVIELRASEMSEDDPSVLSVRSSLVTVLSALGRREESAAIAHDVLQRQRLLLGEDHPDSIYTMSRAARASTLLGNYAEAEALYERGLELAKRALRPDHPQTLNMLGQLGQIRQYQRRLDEAERLMTQALEGWQRTVGDEHPSTLNVMRHLAQVLLAQGRADEAEVLLTQVLVTRRRIFGAEHDATAVAMTALAHLKRRQERFDEAQELMIEALDIYQRTVGRENPQTADALHALGQLYMQMERYDDALDFLAEAVETAERIFPEGHLHIGIYVNAWADALYTAGRFDDAERQFLRVLDIYEMAFGSEHRLTRQVLAKLADIYDARGDVARADELRSRAGAETDQE